jgi:hypothetical protein
MNLDNQCEVKMVWTVVIVNGEISAAVARGDCDEIRVADVIASTVNEMHGEWTKRGGVHCVADLQHCGHGLVLGLWGVGLVWFGRARATGSMTSARSISAWSCIAIRCHFEDTVVMPPS